MERICSSVSMSFQVQSGAEAYSRGGLANKLRARLESAACVETAPHQGECDEKDGPTQDRCGKWAHDVSLLACFVLLDCARCGATRHRCSRS